MFVILIYNRILLHVLLVIIRFYDTGSLLFYLFVEVLYIFIPINLYYYEYHCYFAYI